MTIIMNTVILHNTITAKPYELKVKVRIVQLQFCLV